MDVMSELRPAGELFTAGDFAAGLAKVRDVWDRVPEPKVDTDNAYLILEYGVALSLKLGDLDEAWSWACRAPAFAEKRQDRGEVEFLVGKVAFERADMETAKAQFLVAKRKSQGRLFQGEDVKYRSLIGR